MDEPPSEPPRRGMGARLPKIPSRKNAVGPFDNQIPADDIPTLNKKTDSEVLIGISLFKDHSQDIDGEPGKDLQAQGGNDEEQLDVELGLKPPSKSDADNGMWSKEVPGRVRKGFDTKAKKSTIPTAASMDRLRYPGMKKSNTKGRESENMVHKSFVKRHMWTMLSPTDNRLSMKLFGSRKGIQKEKRRLKAAGNLIIHPCSKFRLYWDIVMLNLILFNIVCLPVVITYFKHEDLSTTWIIFNCIMDTLFMLDVVFNFRTGFMDNQSAEQVVLSPSKIAKHYIKTWFAVDLISSIPMDYVFLMFDNSNDDANKFIEVSRALKILRFAKLLSLVRLLRLSRLMRFVGQYEQVFNVASAVIRICNLVMMMLLIGHWNGCLQFLVPVIQGYPPYSWVYINRLQNASWWEQYTWSLFKALSHMLCIGYGRFPPQSTTDVWLTIISMVSGATCFALFIGHATNLIQSMDSSSRQYREKVKQVEEYMAYNKLPRKMRAKVLDYYEYRYHGKMFDEDQIFSEVSQNILEDVANYNCRDLVSSVPFFVNADPAFVTRVVAYLKFELFQPGDVILSEGTFGDRMFFIQSGIVDVIAKEGYTQTTLSDGSYFGEICLLTRMRRTASVKACSYCTLYSLSVNNFYHVLKEYPSMHRTIMEVAKARLGRLGKESEIIHLDAGMKSVDQDVQSKTMFTLPPDIPSMSSTPGSSKVRTTAQVLREDVKDTDSDERLIQIFNIQDEQGRNKSHVMGNESEYPYSHS